MKQFPPALMQQSKLCFYSSCHSIYGLKRFVLPALAFISALLPLFTINVLVNLFSILGTAKKFLEKRLLTAVLVPPAQGSSEWTALCAW